MKILRGPLIWLVVLACASPAKEEASFRVPRPALTDVDEGVRRQLDELASRVEELLDGSGTEPEEIAAALGELGRHYHAYDLTTDAEICYREALRLAPSADWHYHLGFLQQVRGDLEGAAASFRAVLTLTPEDATARLRLADVFAELGRERDAQRLYSETLEHEREAAAAYRGLGRLAADAGRHREAIAHFERALELEPEATALHHPLAQAYRALGDSGSAERHAALAGPRQVEFPDPRAAMLDELAVGAGVRLARGGVALSEGRVETALDEYRRAVEAAPENPAARVNLALVLARAGQAAAARAELERALELEPSNLEARLTLAQLLAADGELGPAIEAFDRVLEESPEHVGARRGRATVLLATGENTRALADLRRLVEATPDDGLVRLQLGSLLQQSGDREGAERHYRAALALELPPEAEAAARLGLGNLSVERGSFEIALDHYDAALELVPALGEAIYNRAGALARVGRLREAAAAYERYLELDPGNPAALFYLGDTLLGLGDPGNAVAVFHRIGADDPHFERARHGIAVGFKRMGRTAEALSSLEASTRELPRSGLLAHELALTLASAGDRSLRDGARAVELAGRLYASQPSPLYAETLAMALAEAGHFAEAVDIQSRLVAQAADAGDAAGAERLRATLELYRGGEACCPPPS